MSDRFITHFEIKARAADLDNDLEAESEQEFAKRVASLKTVRRPRNRLLLESNFPPEDL